MSKKSYTVKASIGLGVLGLVLIAVGIGMRKYLRMQAAGSRYVVKAYQHTASEAEEHENSAKEAEKEGDDWFILTYFGGAFVVAAVIVPIISTNFRTAPVKEP